MVRSGLVRSRRGFRGGFLLARPASQITLREVIEALQGPITFPVPVAPGQRQKTGARSGGVLYQVLEKAQARVEEAFSKASGERLDVVRGELATGAKQLREEVVTTFKALSDGVTQTMNQLGDIQKGQLEAFSGQLSSFAKASGERLDAAGAESTSGAKNLREEVVKTLGGVSDTVTKTMTGLASAQKTQLDAFASQLTSFVQFSGERLDKARVESTEMGRQLREEVVTTLNSISDTMAKTMKDLALSVSWFRQWTGQACSMLFGRSSLDCEARNADIALSGETSDDIE